MQLPVLSKPFSPQLAAKLSLFSTGNVLSSTLQPSRTTLQTDVFSPSGNVQRSGTLFDPRAIEIGTNLFKELVENHSIPARQELITAALGELGNHGLTPYFPKGINFSDLDLAKANLKGAHLKGANLRKTVLTNANLAGADLRSANLTWANMEKANLAGANLRGTFLEITNLTRANLTEANLAGAHLTQANLTGVNMKKARLTDAYLTGANLMGADFRGAELAGATLDNGDGETMILC